MIYDAPLSAANKRKSQRNYCFFSAFNGFAYMCVGESMLILLAVKVGYPDYFVSIIGALMYLGFLLLPLGKVVCARRGAAYTQYFFWIARNISALIVAVASVMAYFDWWLPSVILFFTGGFLFYGFRAAGVVMSQPLVGSFTDAHDRSQVISLSNGIFYISCSAALLAISLLFSFSSSIWALNAVIILGAGTGIFAASFLRGIDERATLRASARRPLRPELPGALANHTLRRQLGATFMVNLSIILMVPISMLTVKRGYGVSDTQALVFALIQFGSAAMVSLISSRIAEIVGPRKMMRSAYLAMLCIAGLWLMAGEEKNIALLSIIFALAGGSLISMANSNTHYFLQSTEEEHRITFAIIIQTISAAGAGVVGMPLATLLLKISSCFGTTPLHNYQIYFMLAALVLLPGYWLISRLTPLPKEKRRLGKLFWRIFTNSF